MRIDKIKVGVTKIVEAKKSLYENLAFVDHIFGEGRDDIKHKLITEKDAKKVYDWLWEECNCGTKYDELAEYMDFPLEEELYGDMSKQGDLQSHEIELYDKKNPWKKVGQFRFRDNPENIKNFADAYGEKNKVGVKVKRGGEQVYSNLQENHIKYLDIKQNADIYNRYVGDWVAVCHSDENEYELMAKNDMTLNDFLTKYMIQIETNREIVHKEFDSAVSNHIRVYEKSNMNLVVLEFLLGSRPPYVVIENRLDVLKSDVQEYVLQEDELGTPRYWAYEGDEGIYEGYFGEEYDDDMIREEIESIKDKNPVAFYNEEEMRSWIKSKNERNESSNLDSQSTIAVGDLYKDEDSGKVWLVVKSDSVITFKERWGDKIRKISLNDIINDKSISGKKRFTKVGERGEFNESKENAIKPNIGDSYNDLHYGGWWIVSDFGNNKGRDYVRLVNQHTDSKRYVWLDDFMRLSSADADMDRQYLKVGENEVPDNDAIEADLRNRKKELYKNDPEHAYHMTGSYYPNLDEAEGNPSDFEFIDYDRAKKIFDSGGFVYSILDGDWNDLTYMNRDKWDFTLNWAEKRMGDPGDYGFDWFVNKLRKYSEDVQFVIPIGIIQEKAQSKSQQSLMGAALAVKRGKAKNPSKKAKEVAKSMTEKELEKMASTKRKGLPNKVK